MTHEGIVGLVMLAFAFGFCVPFMFFVLFRWQSMGRGLIDMMRDYERTAKTTDGRET